MTTGGEGGMLVTDDDAVADARAAHATARHQPDAWNRYGSGGSWVYEVAEAGFKYNMTDLSAAIGLVQLDRLDELTDARAAIAARYDAVFAASQLLDRPPRRDGDQHSWHLYIVRLNLGELTIDRAEVIRLLGGGRSRRIGPFHPAPSPSALPAALRIRAGRLSDVRGDLRAFDLAADLAGDDRRPGRPGGLDAARDLRHGPPTGGGLGCGPGRPRSSD